MHLKKKKRKRERERKKDREGGRKEGRKKEKKAERNQPTSSNFLIIKKHDHRVSLHCTHIQNLDSERGAPAKLGRSGEEGWLGICCPAGVFAGCGANCRAKQTVRLHFKLLPERYC